MIIVCRYSNVGDPRNTIRINYLLVLHDVNYLRTLRGSGLPRSNKPGKCRWKALIHTPIGLSKAAILTVCPALLPSPNLNECKLCAHKRLLRPCPSHGSNNSLLPAVMRLDVSNSPSRVYIRGGRKKALRNFRLTRKLDLNKKPKSYSKRRRQEGRQKAKP